MKPQGYYRMLLKDERHTRRHLRHLRKHLFQIFNPYLIKNIRDYLNERKHLRNIEAEIKAITDAAFFRYESPLCIEDILNEKHHGNSTQKQLPGGIETDPQETRKFKVRLAICLTVIGMATAVMLVQETRSIYKGNITIAAKKARRAGRKIQSLFQ